jgi:pSer/pThr/pTyr-binding forkhead associated (FHA) protein
MKSFLAACGLKESLRLVVESQRGDEDELRLLRQPFAVIGRDPKADVVLDHPQVSRRHVYVQVVEGRAFWIDLESRTGTRAEQESHRFGWLENDRRLWAGPYAIRRFIDAGDMDQTVDHGNTPRDTPLAALACSRVPSPEATLEFLNGPSQSMLRPVHRVMSLIGSASGCKFRLTDPSISRFHASLLQTSTGLWIIDLLGQSGVLVNGKHVRFERVMDGDVLRLGRYQIRVQYRLPSQSVAKGSLSGAGHRASAESLAFRQRTLSNVPLRDWSKVAMPVESRPEGIEGEQLPALIQRHSAPLRVEVMPSNTTLAGKLGRGDGTESILVPLVNQFGTMQQQMFDQFQQAIAMMVQMFGEMHRDQMTVIREELGRLHELTAEFNELKSQLAGRLREPASSSPTGNLPNAAEANQPVASESRSSEPYLSTGEETLDPSPLSAVITPSVMSGSAEPSTQMANPLATPAILPLIATKQSAPARETPVSPVPTKTTGTALPAADGDSDTVLWLHQRIIALQQERETRWQKILKILPGIP